ncbi:two-component sensor histidine kinase, partial [Mycobacterium tuberculosis]
DLHGAYAYGIFSRSGQPLAGPLLAIPGDLRMDGHAQAVDRWSLRSGPINAPGRALGVETQDGRLLVFVRQS